MSKKIEIKNKKNNNKSLKETIKILENNLIDLYILKQDYPSSIPSLASERDECNNLIIEYQLKYKNLVGDYFKYNPKKNNKINSDY